MQLVKVYFWIKFRVTGNVMKVQIKQILLDLVMPFRSQSSNLIVQSSVIFASYCKNLLLSDVKTSMRYSHELLSVKV